MQGKKEPKKINILTDNNLQGWGFVKIPRKLLCTDFWEGLTVERTWIALVILGNVNYRPKESTLKSGKKIIIQSGEMLTSYDNLAKKCGKGITKGNIRTALPYFEKYNFCTFKKVENQRQAPTLISVCNWYLYQGISQEKVTQDLTQGVTQDLIQEVTQDVTPTSVENTSIQDTIPKEVTQDLTQEVTQGVTQDLTRTKEIKEIKEIKDDKSSPTPSKKDTYNLEIEGIVDYLNLKSDKHFRASTKSTRKGISRRLNEGYTVNDFKQVIDLKAKEWKGTKWEKYLSPDTLFNPTKFEKYINEIPNNEPKEEYKGKAMSLDDIKKTMM